MKRLLALTFSLASIVFVAAPAEAKAAESTASVSTTAAAPAPQWRRNRNRRGTRVYTTTRLVRVGRRVYRETYQVRYLPNGGTRTRLISRVRVR